MKMVMIVMTLLMILSIWFAWQGSSMHAQVTVEEASFHELNADYYSLDKATRDAAETDSELNTDLATIKNYPSELLRLKLVGVGKLLTGIYFLLFGILIALVLMPMRLAQFMQKQAAPAKAAPKKSSKKTSRARKSSKGRKRK